MYLNLKSLISRRQTGRTLNLPPLRNTSKSQLTAEQLWIKKLQPTEKDLQLKAQGRNHNETRRRAGVVVESRPIWWATHKQKNNYDCRGSPQRTRGSESHITPGLGVLCQGDELPESQRGLLCREPESCENRDSVLKQHTQNLTCFGTLYTSSNLKASWV